MVDFFEQSLLFVGEVVDFGLVLASEGHHSGLLLVEVVGKRVDGLVLVVDDVVEPVGLGLEGFGNLLELLVFEKEFVDSLSLQFLLLRPMSPF
jgi:hypothetical protein